MDKEIKAIFLDVGNTLRILKEDPDFQAASRQQLVELTGSDMDPMEYEEFLEKRYKILRKRAKSEMVEASEKEMWTQSMLPDLPYEKIAPLSGKLTRLWRDCDGRRVARPEVTPTVIELHKRGYILGIIANTITESEIPDWLEEDGLTEYFKEVVLSSKVGIRKPDPEIYLGAARSVGVDPAECVYVGDNPIRDIEGAQAAGFGMVIILHEPATLNKYPEPGPFKPDHTIMNLKEILDIFPDRMGNE
jgi:putative hydrolase of the HAD superfamily